MAHRGATAASDACDDAACRAETEVFMLIAVQKPIAPAFSKIETSGNHPVFREQAVVPFPATQGCFAIEISILPDVKAVAGRTAEGTGAAGKAAGGEVVPEMAVRKCLATPGGGPNIPFDAAGKLGLDKVLTLFKKG